MTMEKSYLDGISHIQTTPIWNHHFWTFGIYWLSSLKTTLRIWQCSEHWSPTPQRLPMKSDRTWKIGTSWNLLSIYFQITVNVLPTRKGDSPLLSWITRGTGFSGISTCKRQLRNENLLSCNFHQLSIMPKCHRNMFKQLPSVTSCPGPFRRSRFLRSL